MKRSGEARETITFEEMELSLLTPSLSSSSHLKFCQSPPAPRSPLPQGMSLTPMYHTMCCVVVFGRFASTHTHGQEAESRPERSIPHTQATQATIRAIYAKPPLIPSEASNTKIAITANKDEKRSLREAAPAPDNHNRRPQLHCRSRQTQPKCGNKHQK